MSGLFQFKKLSVILLAFAFVWATVVGAADNTTNTPAAETPATTTSDNTNAPATTEVADPNSPTNTPVPTPTESQLRKIISLPTTNSESSPELGQLQAEGLLPKPVPTNGNGNDRLKQFQMLLDLAREQRQNKSLAQAQQTLISLLSSNAPGEMARSAIFELGLVAQDDGKLVRAEQIFGQYLHIYATDVSAPEVLLRQGLIYRQMGVNNLAVSKFYAVMSTALKLKLDNIDYYKKLVLQAQLEIADTYYLEGKYDEAGDFFSRLLKNPSADLDKTQIQFKLIRSLSFLTNYEDTIARSQTFIEMHTNSLEIPEVRFLLASTLKKVGRNHEAMKQVLLLLQSQQENVAKAPETWNYWQQRAGNEIANQLYKEADYINALQIYLSLAELDKSPTWQLPVWYQTGLVYEQLQQWQKATETYDAIIARQKELTEVNATPSLKSLIEMAKWRKDYLSWFQKAKQTNMAYKSPFTKNMAQISQSDPSNPTTQ